MVVPLSSNIPCTALKSRISHCRSRDGGTFSRKSIDVFHGRSVKMKVLLHSFPDFFICPPVTTRIDPFHLGNWPFNHTSQEGITVPLLVLLLGPAADGNTMHMLPTLFLFDDPDIDGKFGMGSEWRPQFSHLRTSLRWNHPGSKLRTS